MAHDLYICNSNRDEAAADAVCGALEASGLRCWIAPRDVLPGMVWAEAVLETIAQSRLVVLIFSSRANESPHVKREVERVVSIGIPLIPFRIEDVPPSDAFDYFLGSCHWLDAVTPPLDGHLQELVEAAHRTLFTKQPRPPETGTAPELTSTTERDKYDAFISYRRESGAAEARLIRSELRERKVRAFLDADDLKSGHFDEALLRRITDAPNFIVILSPHALDRCSDKRDWLRQEIAQAVKTRRNIIPILLRGFEFPDRESLPDDLKPLPTHNGLEYSHKYFNAMIADILSYLRAEDSLEHETTATDPPVAEQAISKRSDVTAKRAEAGPILPTMDAAESQTVSHREPSQESQQPAQPDPPAVLAKEASSPASARNIRLSPQVWVTSPIGVISPAGGETWESGTTQEIKWELEWAEAEVESIRIELQVWGSSHEAQQGWDVRPITAPPHLPGNATTFQWEIPPSLGAANAFSRFFEKGIYQIKVIARDRRGREVTAASKEGFSIVKAKRR